MTTIFRNKLRPFNFYYRVYIDLPYSNRSVIYELRREITVTVFFKEDFE